METHVKVLGALNIAGGIMGLLSAALLLLVFGGSAAVVGASGDPDGSIAIPIISIGITGIALVSFLVIVSAPGVIVGIGLLNFKPWARIAGIVLSIISLMLIPFGTIIGIYGIWVLFNKETERLFQPKPSPVL